MVEGVAAKARWWAERLAAVSSGVFCEEDADKVGMMLLVIVLLLDDMSAFSCKIVCSDTYE